MYIFIVLEIYMGIRQAITLTGFISMIFYILLPTLLNAELQIKEYPLNDDYFDKTYIIR